MLSLDAQYNERFWCSSKRNPIPALRVQALRTLKACLDVLVEKKRGGGQNVHLRSTSAVDRRC